MRYIICILLIIGSTSIYSQKKNKPNANQNLDSIVNLLNSKIDCEQSNQKKLDSINTNLRNQLIIYKAKEDYFAVALEDQSNRFSLIISVIIAFIGIFSFSWYRVEKGKINNRFKAFNTEFLKIKKDNNELNLRLCSTAGNAYVLSSQLFRSNNNSELAFEFSIYAAREKFKSLSTDKDKLDYTAIIKNLEFAKKDLNILIKDITLKDKLLKIADRIYEDIDMIQTAKDKEVKDLCAEIRVLLLNFLK